MNREKLQRLINRSGTGPIRLPVGTTVIDSSINLGSDVWLVGESRSGTILQASGLTYHLLFAGGEQNIRLENLTLDMDYPTGSGTGTHCLGLTHDDPTTPTLGCTDVFVRDCIIKNSEAYGIGNEGNISHVRLTYENCVFVNVGSDGIDFKSRSNNGTGIEFVGGIIRGCRIYGFSNQQSNDNGIDCRGKVLVKGCTIGPVDKSDERAVRWRNDSGTPGQNGDADYSCLHSTVAIVETAYSGNGFADDGGGSSPQDYHDEAGTSAITIEVNV